MPTVPININNNIFKLSFIIRTSSIYIDDGGDSAVASVGRFNNRRCCDSIRKRRSGAHNNNNRNTDTITLDRLRVCRVRLSRESQL